MPSEQLDLTNEALKVLVVALEAPFVGLKAPIVARGFPVVVELKGRLEEEKAVVACSLLNCNFECVIFL